MKEMVEDTMREEEMITGIEITEEVETVDMIVMEMMIEVQGLRTEMFTIVEIIKGEMKVEVIMIEKMKIIVAEKEMMSIIGISKTIEIIMRKNNITIPPEKMAEI